MSSPEIDIIWLDEKWRFGESLNPERDEQSEVKTKILHCNDLSEPASDGTRIVKIRCQPVVFGAPKWSTYRTIREKVCELLKSIPKAHLEQKHIHPVLDYGWREDEKILRFCEISEKAKGGNLETFLLNQSAGDDSEVTHLAKTILGQVVEALKFAHTYHDPVLGRLGVHRDIKASNILVLSQAPLDLRLTDFEFARPGGPSGVSNLLKSSWNSPPEFRTSQIKHDEAGDVYQLGLLLLDVVSWLRQHNAVRETAVEPLSDEDDPEANWGRLVISGSLWHVIDELPREIRHLAVGLLAHDPASRLTLDQVTAQLNRTDAPPSPDYYQLLPATGDTEYPTPGHFVAAGFQKIKEGNPNWVCATFNRGNRHSLLNWIIQARFNSIRDEWMTKFSNVLEALEAARDEREISRAWTACFLIDPHHPLPYCLPPICRWDDLKRELAAPAIGFPKMLVELARRPPHENLSLLEAWIRGTQSAPEAPLPFAENPLVLRTEISEMNEAIKARLDEVATWTAKANTGWQKSFKGDVSPGVVDRLVFLSIRSVIQRRDELVISQIDGLGRWKKLPVAPPRAQIGYLEDLPNWILSNLELADELRRTGVLGVWIDSQPAEKRESGFGLESFFSLPFPNLLLTVFLAVELKSRVPDCKVHDSSIEAAWRESLREAQTEAEALRLWRESAFQDLLAGSLKSVEGKRFVERYLACTDLVKQWNSSGQEAIHRRNPSIGYWMLRYSLFSNDGLQLRGKEGTQVDLLDPVEVGSWMLKNGGETRPWSNFAADDLRRTGIPCLWAFVRRKFADQQNLGEALWSIDNIKDERDLVLTTLMARQFAGKAVGPRLLVGFSWKGRTKSCFVEAMDVDPIRLPEVHLGQLALAARYPVEIKFTNVADDLLPAGALGWMQGTFRLEGDGIDARGKSPKVFDEGENASGSFTVSTFYPRSDGQGEATVHISYNHLAREKTTVQIPLRFQVLLDHQEAMKKVGIAAGVGAVCFFIAGYILQAIYSYSQMGVDPQNELLAPGSPNINRTLNAVDVWFHGFRNAAIGNWNPIGPIVGPSGGEVTGYWLQGAFGLVLFSVLALLIWLVGKWSFRPRREEPLT